jgi:hypothetical protein
MQTLFAISRISPIVKDSLEGQPIGHCSSMLYLQLKLVVGKAIRQLEVEILSKVDKLVLGPENIGLQSPLALWVCLWVLILSYKENMVLTKAYEDASKFLIESASISSLT